MDLDLDYLLEDLIAKDPDTPTDLETLLHRAIAWGTERLYALASKATMRLVRTRSVRLFNDPELVELAGVLATVRAAGDLLARGFVRELAAAERYEYTGEVTESLRTLSESIGSDAPLISPEAALKFFLDLFPMLGVDPMRYGDDLRRHAFTLAVATSEELLGRVHDAIRAVIETGKAVAATPGIIDDLLTSAGVTPKNPQYSEMVFRTNYMDSVNTGAFEELRAESEVFPVWQYSSVADERSRPTHAARDGNYYPSSMTFVQVRGTGIEDAANCRCTFVPISKWKWARLQAQGARLAA